MDRAIDAFFNQLLDLWKCVDEDVAYLKRSLDQGYSVGPQQLGEQLEQLQRQCTEVEKGLMEMKSQKEDSITLTDLSKSALVLYQTIASGIEVVEAHQCNYGYDAETRNKPPADPEYLPFYNDLSQEQQRCVTHTNEQQDTQRFLAGRSVSLAGPFSTAKGGLYYPGNAEEGPSQSRESFESFSHETLQCSPKTIALKKKYTRQEDLPLDEAVVSDRDSFEFRPHTRDGESDMDIDMAPLSPIAKPRSSERTLLISPRVSFTEDQGKFGSPFRSPNKKPEPSVFIDPPLDAQPSWISNDLYHTLPPYLKQSVPLSRLNAMFPRLQCLFPSPGAFLSQSELECPECIGDRFIVQAFMKLNILERQFKNGSFVYGLLLTK